ncbi:MAG TPA: c-type cytochrome [Steroidobacteraceae bacterium]|nr:c-type cytochrome [Steroidobacteraceae bacterium]
MQPHAESRTRVARGPLLLALASSAVAQAAPASHAAGAALAQHGAATVRACASCHGAAGEGTAASGSPRLAGLPAAYLLEQLDAMAAGSRASAAMAPVARVLTAEQRTQLAEYYGSLPRSVQPLAGVAAALDDRLALEGRWAQEIPPCVQCHGQQGSGVGVFPPLAGQRADYIAAQLRAWRDGTRRGGPLALMQKIAARLSEADIRAVADYFAAQPAPSAAPAHRAAAAQVVREPASDGLFHPSDEPVPDNEFGRVVRFGRDVFENPGKYAARYVGNDLRCSSCHLDAGRRVGSAPMWAAYVSYPAWRAKNGHVNTYAERLQGCFRYSMNGSAPPLGDPVLVALETYSYWMARGAPVDPEIPGRGYPTPAKPPLSPDRTRGGQVYARSCAFCHAADGGGQRDNHGNPAFPALWGANSYNWGAGMVNVSKAAAFIKSNMPLSQGNTLSDQDAWDVALFVDSHERPQDPRYTGSVAHTRSLYHDRDDSMYGQVVDGYQLGSRAVPPGRHPPAPGAR